MNRKEPHADFFRPFHAESHGVGNVMQLQIEKNVVPLFLKRVDERGPLLNEKRRSDFHFFYQRSEGLQEFVRGAGVGKIEGQDNPMTVFHRATIRVPPALSLRLSGAALSIGGYPPPEPPRA